MKLSNRIAVGMAVLLGALSIVGLAMFLWPVLDQRFHLLSDHMRQVAIDYEFRLLGLFLLAFAPFCLLLEAVWWVGRKLKVPYFVLVLICLSLIVIAYFWVGHEFRGTLRG